MPSDDKTVEKPLRDELRQRARDIGFHDMELDMDTGLRALLIAEDADGFLREDPDDPTPRGRLKETFEEKERRRQRNEDKTPHEEETAAYENRFERAMKAILAREGRDHVSSLQEERSQETTQPSFSNN